MRARCPEVPRSLRVFPPMPVFRPADTQSKPFLVATRVKQEDSADLARQAGLRHRATIGQLYPSVQRRFLLQMIQYLPDDHRVFDTSSHLRAFSALPKR